ncbi:Copper-binding protein [Rhodanobacter sp. Root179]|jgi:Cu(I)/Ag(I) efflux system protein CusF|uniref:copper-binding protein n=1 Tax=Rhodanobacter sp. Root179 TaxID=1736482 RepID=UPI0007021F44|nr:copper-binding protein [Rhodanobacter sp. Root179]KRB44817.1 copper-binding protein [Rhodanobacter sp. Root179]
MKKHLLTFALTGALLPASSVVAAQKMDPNMPGMTGMQHDAKPADAQGTGIVKAIDTVKNTITLQHEAITAIGWPAMTMPFKVASPDLLKHVKVGDEVQFTLHPAGMASTVTSITPAQ